MAEFVRTMKEWQRMCDSIKSCVHCPLYNEDEWAHTLCSEGGILSAKPEVVETVVAKWAAEHQEPVYPTWVEWLVERFGYDLREIMYNPIPTSIAEKLGIEPKEG